MGQISLVDECACESLATLPRTEVVADGVGKVAALFRRPSSLDGVAGDEPRLSLLAEDLDQPPPVAQLPGKDARLGEVSSCHLGVVTVAQPQAVSARANNAGSLSSRAMVRARSASSML